MHADHQETLQLLLLAREHGVEAAVLTCVQRLAEQVGGCGSIASTGLGTLLRAHAHIAEGGQLY